MPPSPARFAAYEILLRVDRDQSYASELLHSERNEKLSSKDRGLATELVMGVLRWRSVLDSQLATASTQKLERLDAEVLVALRLGIYQLVFLSRVPARAAIFESVELVKSARKRSAASFVNAVLRRASASSKQSPADSISIATSPVALAESSAHPQWLVDRWVDRYGFAAGQQICIHDQAIPETTIHLANKETADELAEAGVVLSSGALLSSARQVISGDVTKTNAYREGCVHIQDEASQLVAHLAGRGNQILDCCAAPGSKTALLSERNRQALVVACDIHPRRAGLLRDRVRKKNVHVVAADARHLPFLPAFDLILADVPCSGTGTLSRNPDIKWRLKPEDLLDLQLRQIAILQSAYAQIIPGGRLIYSTCSLEREENEAVVETALNAISDARLIPCRGELERLQRSGELVCKDLDSLIAGPYLHTVPGLHPCDGFFVAIIERSK